MGCKDIVLENLSLCQIHNSFPFYFQKLLLIKRTLPSPNYNIFMSCVSWWLFVSLLLENLRKSKLLDTSLKPLIWLQVYNLLFTKFCDKKGEAHCKECILMCHVGLGSIGIQIGPSYCTGLSDVGQVSRTELLYRP